VGLAFSMLNFDIPSCAGEDSQLPFAGVEDTEVLPLLCFQEAQHTDINSLLLHILGLVTVSQRPLPAPALKLSTGDSILTISADLI
jgi:hypothetical protein